MRATVAAVAALAGAARAATTTSSYTDSTTGITFQRWEDSSTGFAFGLALPEDPSADADIIGQMVAPGAGWGGVSMTSSMMASTLIAAWPNGEDIVASARKTNAYSNPAVMDGVTLKTVPEGTFVNSTHFSYTFLCSGCLTGDSGAFDVTGTTAVIGWALSDSAPTTPSSASSVLNYHAAGFGAFGMPIADAESADFATWSKLATGTSDGSSSSGASNSTATPAATTPSSTPLATPSTLSETYDYIVVGGGAAGLVAAGRLAETKGSVLLIERGGESTASCGGTDMLDWNSTVTPYDVPAYGYAVSATGDVSYCTDTASQAGCILGGSTSINAEMFVRPSETDFENWPEGWTWADVESSAEAFYERNPGSNLPSADGRRYNQAAYETLSKLFESNGWSEVDAIEEPAKKDKVFAHPPWNVKDALRAGPLLTYLPDAKKLDNFKLQTNSKVVRVMRTGSAVTGVEIETSDGSAQIINLTSNGKVVLAAGALSTPRILFNSGIGPTDQLEVVNSADNGITLDSADYIELPVGKGLKDHPILSMRVKVAGGNMTVFDPTNPSDNDVALYKQGSGPLAEGMQRLNFWTSVDGSDGKTRYVQGTTSVKSADEITVKVYLTHGLTSTGRLGIDESGATTLMTEPWLNTDADKAAITSFLDDFFGYVQASGTLSVTPADGSAGNVTAADLISKLTTGSHFVGTAKMGTDSGLEADGTSVVDTDCKVYGTDNLYVVDASIHPDLPTGNTQAIVYVAAEHAAKKIAGQTTTVDTGSEGSSSAASSSSAVAAVTASSSSAAAEASTPAAEAPSSSSSAATAATTTPATTSAPAAANGGASASTVTTTVTVKNTKLTTVYVTVTPGAASTSAAGNVAAAFAETSATATSVVAPVQAVQATTLATHVVAAASTETATAASDWTDVIPSAALTQVVAVPTGSAAPAGAAALPEGTRIRDVLEWFTFVFESVAKGSLRK